MKQGLTQFLILVFTIMLFLAFSEDIQRKTFSKKAIPLIDKASNSK